MALVFGTINYTLVHCPGVFSGELFLLLHTKSGVL